jgi:hypothetical protein
MEQNISGLGIGAIQYGCYIIYYYYYYYMQFRHFNMKFKWDIQIWCQGCGFMHCLCDANG